MDLQHLLGWIMSEKRCLHSKLVTFYKIYHQPVAIPLPTYLEIPTRLTRQMHPFSPCQTHVNWDFLQCSFFPHTTVLSHT